MKRVGLFGGSFDPIHFGHINIAISAKENHNLDEIWFCPSYNTPAKNSSHADPKERYKMLHIALNNLSWAKILDFEINRPGYSYTIDTIKALQQDKNNIELQLIIGDDTVEDLHLWKDIDTIIKLCPLIIGKRNCIPPICKGNEKLIQAVTNGSIFPNPIMQIESSTIKKRIRAKLYCAHLVPEKVLDYIYQNQLYS
jgi:nicotinate-nucleotide adenylyltransferase